MVKKNKGKKTTKTAASDTAAAAAPVTMTVVEQPSNNQTETETQADEEQTPQKGHGAQASKDMHAMLRFLTEKHAGELELSKNDKELLEIREEVQRRKIARLKALANTPKPPAVKLNEADVALVMNEFELTRPVAERHLREQGGDLDRTLRALLSC
jgi:NACalpha-BTF3-like transcription factor